MVAIAMILVLGPTLQLDPYKVFPKYNPLVY